MTRPLSFLALLALTACFLRAEIEFSGFFTTSKEALFALTDTATHTSSGWLKIDQTFRGYTVVSFDAEHDTIVLRQGAQSIKLPLRASKVKEGKSIISGMITVGVGEKLEGVRASFFLGEESAFPIKDDVTLYLKAELLPNGNYLYSSRFVRRTADGKDENPLVPSRHRPAGSTLWHQGRRLRLLLQTLTRGAPAGNRPGAVRRTPPREPSGSVPLMRPLPY